MGESVVVADGVGVSVGISWGVFWAQARQRTRSDMKREVTATFTSLWYTVGRDLGYKARGWAFSYTSRTCSVARWV
jgi:hypothetical protein